MRGKCERCIKGHACTPLPYPLSFPPSLTHSIAFTHLYTFSPLTIYLFPLYRILLHLHLPIHPFTFTLLLTYIFPSPSPIYKVRIQTLPLTQLSPFYHISLHLPFSPSVCTVHSFVTTYATPKPLYLIPLLFSILPQTPTYLTLSLYHLQNIFTQSTSYSNFLPCS